MVVCNLGVEDSEVLLMRTGSSGVRLSAVVTREQMFNNALDHIVYRLHLHSCCLIT